MDLSSALYTRLWEEHYNAITLNIDATAERVRQLGGYPLGTAAGFIEYGSLKEHPNDLPSANRNGSAFGTGSRAGYPQLREDIDKCGEQFPR